MARNLVLTIRLYGGRYHGARDWPPSPARLFQALIAGAARGATVESGDYEALKWLEDLDPPTIGSPPSIIGQRVEMFVPDNDIDALDGDPERAADIRSSKLIQPRLFNSGVPFIYLWTFEEEGVETPQAETICNVAERLYQFGRGVDMAWARGEILDDREIDTRLSNYPGPIFRASRTGRDRTLACPHRGSLASLTARYVASSHRFETVGLSMSPRQLFSQPPKPRFLQVPYDSPPSRRVYELRDANHQPEFARWPLTQASSLVAWLRDGAAGRLRHALPQQSTDIERALIGRKADGADDGPAAGRVRIVPLPSIGHRHADRGIRRVLIEVPPGCLVRADDVHWAFSGLDHFDSETGVIDSIVTPSVDENMLARYGATDDVRSRVWRTVTPAALPESAKRRRIDPTRVAAEAKDGAERVAEQARAAAAVTQALRHIEERTHLSTIRVQREPFESRGQRAEAFAPGSRFAKERLWHVEIAFAAPIAGPLVIGDGRFLGLGVMAPVERAQGVHVFVIDDGLVAEPDTTEVTRSLRRAIMARVQQVLGPRETLSAFFTGHERDGSPARTEHPHLTFAFDPVSTRLLVLAPHVVDRRATTPGENVHLATLDEALANLTDLRAGSSGRFALRATIVDAEADPLFAASRTWESVTPYQVTRHTKHVGAAEALSADLRAECRRCGLPDPRVTSRELHGVPGVGLMGDATLTFAVAIRGPVTLGRSRHLGGGLFAATAK